MRLIPLVRHRRRQAMEPKLSTIKRLFALSGNQCAFQGCSAPIVEGSGSITGVVCHICARSPGGPRYYPMQTDEDRHGFENLVLMCARHSKLIDNEPERYSPKFLRDMKTMHEKGGSIELSALQAHMATLLWENYKSIHISVGGHVMVNSPGAIQAEKVTIKTNRASIRPALREGTIAADRSKRNYVKHLIDQYNNFASKQPGRKFSFVAIYADIKKRFGAHWEENAIEKFPDIVAYLQQRTDGTRLGRINHGKGYPNYSTYEEYRRKYRE